MTLSQSNVLALLLILLGAMMIPALPPAAPAWAGGQDTNPLWHELKNDKSVKTKLYFFYSETCPHCAAAQPFIERLGRENPWLTIEAHEVTDEQGQGLFFMLSLELGVQRVGVPAFFACGKALFGFDNERGRGVEVLQLAESCRHRPAGSEATAPTGTRVQAKAPDVPDALTIPFVGAIDPNTLSLPALTLLLGGLDAFNPCAFFVLLFLLSLMVHAKSRTRMAIVGGTFVTVSGLMYFVFMAAWLNLFLVLENVGWITRAAGLVAIAIGLLGVKDFFLFKEGPSLSVSEKHKQGLYARMRSLISAEHLPTLLAGTMMLAIAANTYELICTSGFPLVFTRILTLSDLSAAARYGYLALYNVIYVLPLLTIVALFVWTLGARKLSEREGRALKLVSGLVMLSMGVILIWAPQIFDDVLTAITVFAGAIITAGFILIMEHFVLRWREANNAERRS